MYYLGYEIDLECITQRDVYELLDNGEIGKFVREINTEPEPSYYGIKLNGVYLDWVSYDDHTIDDVFYRIKQLKKEREDSDEK